MIIITQKSYRFNVTFLLSVEYFIFLFVFPFQCCCTWQGRQGVRNRNVGTKFFNELTSDLLQMCFVVTADMFIENNC